MSEKTPRDGGPTASRAGGVLCGMAERRHHRPGAARWGLMGAIGWLLARMGDLPAQLVTAVLIASP
ncbi:MAG: hypothetical protein ACR2LV_08180 [Solirubrobacteraceae bacterium]